MTWQRGSWKLLKVCEKSMAELKAVLLQSPLNVLAFSREVTFTLL